MIFFCFKFQEQCKEDKFINQENFHKQINPSSSSNTNKNKWNI